MITIMGNNFGPSGTELSVTFGQNGADYEALSCFHLESHILLQCITPPATGSAHKWIVSVAGQQSVVPTTSIAPPEINIVYRLTAHNFSTAGGEWFVINGTDFGQHSSKISVRYINEFGVVHQAKKCTFLEKHTSIKCMTIEGYGEKLSWQVVVDGQDSEWKDSQISYDGPKLTSATPPIVSTKGVLTLHGENFGPLGVARVLVDNKGVEISKITYISHEKIEVSVPEVNRLVLLPNSIYLFFKFLCDAL